MPPSSSSASACTATTSTVEDGSAGQATALFRDKLRRKLEATGGLSLGGRLAAVHKESNSGDSKSGDDGGAASGAAAGANPSGRGRGGGRRKAATTAAAAAPSAAATTGPAAEQQQQVSQSPNSLDPLIESTGSLLLNNGSNASAAASPVASLLDGHPHPLGFFACGPDALGIDNVGMGMGMGDGSHGGGHTHMSLLSPHEDQSMLGAAPLPLPSPTHEAEAAAEALSVSSRSTAGGGSGRNHNNANKKRKKKEMQQAGAGGGFTAAPHVAAAVVPLPPLNIMGAQAPYALPQQLQAQPHHHNNTPSTPPAKKRPEGQPRHLKSGNKSCSKLSNPIQPAITMATGAGDVVDGGFMGGGLSSELEEQRALAALFFDGHYTGGGGHIPPSSSAATATNPHAGVVALPPAGHDTHTTHSIGLADFEEVLQASITSQWGERHSNAHCHHHQPHHHAAASHHRPSVQDFDVALTSLHMAQGGGVGGMDHDHLFAPSTFGF